MVVRIEIRSNCAFIDYNLGIFDYLHSSVFWQNLLIFHYYLVEM